MFHLKCSNFFFGLLVFLSWNRSISSKNSYQPGDLVKLYVNKVGPYWNPHETYHYYQLPGCHPNKIEHRSLTLGEVLDGDRMAESLYNVRFKEDQKNAKLCEKSLSGKEVSYLRKVIEELYYFEFVLDDLAMRGFVGEFQEMSNFVPHRHIIRLFTHYTFHIHYNDQNIIFCNISVTDRAPFMLEELPTFESKTELIQFTYSVVWHQTDVKYGERLKFNRRTNFFPKSLEIHWLSIINSGVLVLLLLVFLIIILGRILKNDLSLVKCPEDPEPDECGWKIIHTDVFRFPKHKIIFCSIIGVGAQFFVLVTGILLMTLFGLFNVHRHGALTTASVLLYALTCGVSGYISNYYYAQMEGKSWVWCTNLTACVFTFPFFIIWSVENTVAWIYGSTQALPISTIVILFSLCLFLGYPLTIIGGIWAKRTAGSFSAPCRTKQIAREIPSVSFLKSPGLHVVVGGFLPFTSISVELYYIISTLWGREQYSLYGILFLVFIIVVMVTACVNIALTYYSLSAEDYRWWWKSILSSGVTGFFILAYAFFYFFKRSQMYGGLETLQFFGYSFVASYIFALTLSVVGFYSSLVFIRFIYSNFKID
ncbi:hypothetical protein SNEBB_010259 [Seison nebaliae]|nr:hypothetical protein SNEBB_010259 [Seison nebaliae]